MVAMSLCSEVPMSVMISMSFSCEMVTVMLTVSNLSPSHTMSCDGGEDLW